MNMKKLTSVLTSAVLLSGIACSVPVQTDGTGLFSAPITAEAASFVSGIKTTIVFDNTCANTKLYFRQNQTDRHLEVCGCEVYGAVNSPLTIPDTVKVNGTAYPVTAIADAAFYNQTALRCVNNFSGQITSIGCSAFYGCTSLNSVQFVGADYKSTIKTIGAGAFGKCAALPGVQGCIENAEEIGPHAFNGCTGLTEIKLTKVTSLGEGAFYECSGLKTIDISEAPLRVVGKHAFTNCTQAFEVHLPETVTTISMAAFNNCDALEKIYLPDSVTTIEHSAFYHCDNLKTVMMSENISSIGDYAFCDCPKMTFFVSKNPNAAIGQYAIGMHLENGYMRKNKVFTIWSTAAGSVKTYANRNSFEFRTVKGAASYAESRFLPYEWCRCMFDWDTWSDDGMVHFTDKHRQFVNDSYLNREIGFLAALEAVSVLTSSGYISVKDYAPRYSTLRNINPSPMETTSYLLTVDSRINITEKGDYHSKKKFSKEMLRYAEYITYGADAAVLLTRKNSCAGYFSACFGMEFRENAYDKNNACWNGWDARLLIYKPSTRRKHNEADYVYVKLSDGSWRDGNVSNASSYSFTLNHRPDTILAAIGGMDPDDFLAAIRN